MSYFSLLRLRPNHAGGTPTTEENLPTEAQLSAWRRSLSPEVLSDLQSALSERDSSERKEALMGFAERQVMAGDLQTAAEVFSIVDHPRAQARLLELQGQGGNWSRRVEDQFRQMSADMLHPANLLAMAGAGLAFQGVRLAGASWTLNREMGLAPRILGKILVQIGAVSAEAGAFTSIQHAYHRLAGDPHASFVNFKRDLASNHLTFSGLRLGASTLGRYSPVLGLLSGVMLAQYFQSAAGLRASQDDSHRLADILVTSAQFFITGQVVGRLPFLQRAWAGAERWANRVDWARELESQGRRGQIDLLPAQRVRFIEALNSIHSGEISQIQGRDQLVTILWEDLLHRTRTLCLNHREIPWKQWLSEQRNHPEAPEWIERALNDPKGENWKISQMEVPLTMEPEPLAQVESRDSASCDLLGGLQHLLQEQFNLPSGTLLNSDQDSTILHFLPNEFLWNSSLYRNGRETASETIFPDLVTLEHLGSLATADLRPVTLSGRYLQVHNLSESHPYVTWLHDIYHLLEINTHSPSVRKEIASLYQILHWTKGTDGADLPESQRLLGDLLDGGLSDRGDHSRLFFRVFSPNFSRSFQENALSLLRSSLRSSPRDLEILRQAESARFRR